MRTLTQGVDDRLIKFAAKRAVDGFPELARSALYSGDDSLTLEVEAHLSHKLSGRYGDKSPAEKRSLLYMIARNYLISLTRKESRSPATIELDVERVDRAQTATLVVDLTDFTITTPYGTISLDDVELQGSKLGWKALQAICQADASQLKRAFTSSDDLRSNTHRELRRTRKTAPRRRCKQCEGQSRFFGDSACKRA